MPFVLRIDIDKPYGSSNLFQRVVSKLREDYWFPVIEKMGYLHSVEKFMIFCNTHKVRGMWHFRNCTLPSSKILRLIDEGAHVIGFHAEDTKSLSSFRTELSYFRNHLPGRSIPTFSKHGSGYHKLGRNHYRYYEPEKYLEWSRACNIAFPYGNGIASMAEDFIGRKFYPNIFWIERPYRDPSLQRLDQIIEIAKHHTVPILIHPENFCSTKAVRTDFEELINQAKANHIEWVIPYT